MALHLFDEHPQQARDALATIKQSSKEALVELRSILGLLRRADEDAPRAPTPSLTHLDELVARSNAAGLDVHVDLDADVEHLPRDVDLAAYRIIQESLTNVLKHAAHATASVGIRYRIGELELHVRDDGTDPGMDTGRPDRDNMTGRGLINMRERAHLFGGRFEAAALPDGGFAVTAVLPTGTP